MQNFLSLWLNAGAQITHGGQVQRPRQGQYGENIMYINVYIALGGYQVIVHFARWPNVPHAPPSFVETEIQNFYPLDQLIQHFSDTAISQATIQRLFKEMEDRAGDARNMSLQRRARLEVVDDLVEIEGLSPYCTSKL